MYQHDSITPASWFKIDDGSGVSVKCLIPNGVAIDSSWTHAGVTGISSCEKIGNDLIRLIKVKADDGIAPYVTAP